MPRSRPPRSHPSTRPMAAAATAGALVLLCAAPGVAAEPVAQATASAVTITLAGQAAGSDTYRVTNDGTAEEARGSNGPAITALGNQPFLAAGTLAQDAVTRIDEQGRGSSAACAGLAGDGATLVAAGGGACLEPGENAVIEAGTLQLEDVTLVESDLLQGLDAQLQAALQPLLDPVLAGAQEGLQTALEAFGDPAVVLDLGAIQSACVADPRTADGDAQLVDAGLYLRLPQAGRLDLLSLPVNPPPNTKVVTNLDVLVTAITDAVEEQLATGLDGALAPAGPFVDELSTQLTENVLSVLAEQLAPLEENLIDGTLNAQERSPGAITVTALDLQVLPVAMDDGLLRLQIGTSACGPSGRVADPDPDPDPPTNRPDPEPPPDVPTRVPSGLSSAPVAGSSDGSVNDVVALIALGGLGALATAAGVVTYRRVARR